MGVPKQKTLFKKYLRITMAIVLASFLLLGMVMLVFVSQYWENEKRDLLRQNAQYVARMAEAASVYDESQQRYELNSSMEFLMQGFSENIDADIFITDQNGQRLLGAYTNSNIETDRTVDPSIMRQVLVDGGYESQGTLSGVYRENYYIVGEPVLVDDVPIGAVFVATSIQAVSSYRMKCCGSSCWLPSPPLCSLSASFGLSPISWSNPCGRCPPQPKALARGISPCGCR